MSRFVLYRVTNIQDGKLELTDAYTQNEVLSCKPSRQQNLHRGQLIVYDTKYNVVCSNFNLHRGLFTEYREYTQFMNIVKNSPQSERYFRLLDQGHKYTQIYSLILIQNSDLIAEVVNKRFIKTYKFTFKINLPFYQQQFDQMCKELVNKEVYYLEDNTFYTRLKLNPLLEKQHVQFYNQFKNCRYIDFSTVII